MSDAMADDFFCLAAAGGVSAVEVLEEVGAENIDHGLWQQVSQSLDQFVGRTLDEPIRPAP